MKNSIKRAQSQACLGFAERKNFRPLAKLKKLSLTLALLITAATSAWAQTEETLLTTITNTGENASFRSGSKTFDDIATVTFGAEVKNDGDNWGWYTMGSNDVTLTVTAASDAYTITRVKFYCADGSAFDEEAPFLAIVRCESGSSITKVNGTSIGLWGVTKIEVYGYEGTAEPAGPEVTITGTSAEGQQAEFDMPQYDVTATYTIKRDMRVDVAGEMADRIRIEMVDNKYQAVDATLLIPVVNDNLEANSPVTLTANTDYTLQLQKQSDTNADEWTDATALSVGNFRYKITGAGNYSGVCYSEEFRLFKGYQLEIAAGEYATFYMNEVLKVDESTADGQLYTITNVDMEGGTATASDVSVADSETPLLVKNNAAETKTILLVPTTDTADEVTVAEQFKGTLVALPVSAADMDVYDYYVCNGRAFVWVKDAGTIPANRAWLQLPTGNAEARTLRIIFSDETTGVDAIRNINTGDWYDLNGRKLPAAPTRKGVYILNGKKAVVK